MLLHAVMFERPEEVYKHYKWLGMFKISLPSFQSLVSNNDSPLAMFYLLLYNNT